MSADKRRLLIVEDEATICQCKRILEGAGYAVVTAATGREALDKLPPANFTLVLLDIKMPALNGFQTLRL